MIHSLPLVLVFGLRLREELTVDLFLGPRPNHRDPDLTSAELTTPDCSPLIPEPDWCEGSIVETKIPPTFLLYLEGSGSLKKDPLASSQIRGGASNRSFFML